MKIVRPESSDELLLNPGIGFMTFQRFNGDSMNPGTGWTEGYPIDHQPFSGSLEIAGHPLTSLAYFRLYWRFLEPAPGGYAWELIDRALETAASRSQTLLLRIAPYGTGDDNDVPDWYRTLVGAEPHCSREKWRTDPENPLYVERFGGLIRALGARYHEHPHLESVDLSIVGPWGEGEGSDRLSEGTRTALLDCYLDAFPRTPLLMLLTDPATNGYGISRRDVGWRADCLGDMGGFSKTWCHMYDAYPQQIIECGLADAWKKAPVSFEVCWVMQHWKDQGWDVDHIIEQSLKWHISSFNAKSSPVPQEWEPVVERWLKRMGYRLALRKFTYPEEVNPGGALEYTSWWENKGVAPCYRPFRLALRIRRAEFSAVLPLDADIRTWLPGDSLSNGAVTVPAAVPPGDYELEIGILDERTDRPKVQLAIPGRTAEGWYPLGAIRVKNNLTPGPSPRRRGEPDR